MLYPKNWQTFQHYKDRNPPWIKLHKSLLDDPVFQCLPVASRALAPMLWLQASCEVDGHIDMTTEQLAFRLRMTHKELLDALNPLIMAGLFVDASGMLASCLQDARPETETKPEKETKREAKQTTKKRLKKETSSIPEDLLPEVVRLCSVWPRQSIGDIGPGGAQKTQDLRAWSDPVDLYEHWVSAYPTVEPAILAACGAVYLEGIEYVEDEWTGKKTPKYCYAMRNFYGQKEYWKLFKGAALERLKDAIR